MKITQLAYGICLSCFFCSGAFADIEISKIDEMLLLDPPSAGKLSREVIIYSGVRDSVIHMAMDDQFEQIENMMFVNTVIESETGELSYGEDNECD